MKRAIPIVCVLLVLLVPAVLWFARPGGSALPGNSSRTAPSPGPAAPPAGPVPPLPGETILRDYASTNLPPENDLDLIARLMDSFTLLVKTARDRPLSANEDWAAALRGLNPAHERLLPEHSIALSGGKLVDRWGSPLFFHALGGGRYELRSAGPDRKLWTEDDVHRNADGTFRRGSNLNPPSLLDAAARARD